jgi:hypothetical protein
VREDVQRHMEGIGLGQLRRFNVVWLELLSIVDRMEGPLTKNLCNEDVLPSLNRKTLSYDGIPSFIHLQYHFLCNKQNLKALEKF